MNAVNQAHEEAQSLLPWLANGSLAGAELERVQSHVKGCAACRTELALLHTLRAANVDTAPAADADADAALARLLPQLDAPDAPDGPPLKPLIQADSMPIPMPAPHGWRARIAANDRSWLRVAAAAQFCVIVALGAMLLRSPADPGVHADAYKVLGASAGARHGLVLAFNPETPEREIRRIVLASGARVVGGPTATGAWLLETEAAPAAVMARLRAEPAVSLAEELGAGSQP
jgi:hypothetical protein